MNWLHKSVALWTGLLLATSAYAQSQPSLLHRILERGVVRVGTTGDHPPFSTRNPASDSYEGMDIDYANRIAADLGVKVEFVPTSWPSLVAGLQAGKYDIAMSGITITLERMKSVAFSDSYLDLGIIAVVRQEHASKFKSSKDLNNPEVRFAVQLGTTAEAIVRRHFPTARITALEPPALSFQEVLAGRADVSMNDNIAVARLVKRNPTLVMVDPNNPIEGSPQAIMTVQGDQVWLNWLNAWVKLRREDKFLESRYQHWVAEYTK